MNQCKECEGEEFHKMSCTQRLTMKTKVIIAGGRDFLDAERLMHNMNTLFATRQNLYSHIQVISGLAKGADSLGKQWAEEYDVPVLKFPADWDTHGKSAGHIRNAEMAEVGDILVAFWDGKSKGTKGMIDVALRKGLTVHVYRYTPVLPEKPKKYVNNPRFVQRDG